LFWTELIAYTPLSYGVEITIAIISLRNLYFHKMYEEEIHEKIIFVNLGHIIGIKWISHKGQIKRLFVWSLWYLFLFNYSFCSWIDYRMYCILRSDNLSRYYNVNESNSSELGLTRIKFIKIRVESSWVHEALWVDQRPIKAQLVTIKLVHECTNCKTGIWVDMKLIY
jgi:hypothetical protein